MAGLALPRGRSLALDPFAVMGVINATPDSFYAASRHAALDEGLRCAMEMVGEGAAAIDIGGESTRPGSAPVDEAEEIERVVPLIAAIRKESDIPISVDTRKEGVWRAALEAGADILNDVAALRDAPGSAALCAAAGAPVVLMHMRGEPATMQEAPRYDDCLAEVSAFLADAAAGAMAAGIPRASVVLDPGIGFGKRLGDNLALIAGLGSLVALGHPVLVGLSRKSFIGMITGRPAEDRLAGSLGAAAAAWQAGARIFRVHDVGPTIDLLKVLAAVAGAAGPRPGTAA